MVENGYPGHPQVQPDRAPQDDEGRGYGAGWPTSEERTITSSMTKDQVLRLVTALAETEGLEPPHFHWNGRRYWIERAVEWTWPGLNDAKPGDVKRVGFDLIVMFGGGAIRMAARTK